VASDSLQELLEQSVANSRFAMPALMKDFMSSLSGSVWAQRYRQLSTALGDERVAHYVFQGILRAAFFIEFVKTRGGATKMTVRWDHDIGSTDPRYATYETCRAIFDKATAELLDAMDDPTNRELLRTLSANHLVAYEIPLDYVRREVGAPIHQPSNMTWIWDDKIKRAVKLRAYLRDDATTPYAGLFRVAYEKIQVKTYLTDRVQTGEHKTNREKRWETHSASVHFALRRTCMGVEYKLITQLCRFAGFPADFQRQLEAAGLLPPGENPVRCPITEDPLSFDEFKDEIENPKHGLSSFQVGHLNPLKAVNDDPLSGHTAENISWISSNGNRIQGPLTLDDTRKLLKRIVRNYAQLGRPLISEPGENLDVPKDDTMVEASEGDLREPPDEL
jgi:hypothetical protein